MKRPVLALVRRDRVDGARRRPRTRQGPLAPPTLECHAADIRPLIGKPTIVPTRAIAGKPTPHGEQFRNGTARFALTLPTYAKDKLLTVKVAIKLGTKSSTRTATFRAMGGDGLEPPTPCV